ncbi:MAG TPA: hypothetical protein V6D47_14100 [Oscillatoriaceae cyanobacterium]
MISFDPIAREVVIDFEDGGFPLSLCAERVTVKHYGDEGILFAELTAADAATVGHISLPGLAPVVLSLEALGGRCWRVTLPGVV